MLKEIKMKRLTLLDVRATTLVMAYILDFIINLNKPCWISKSTQKEG